MCVAMVLAIAGIWKERVKLKMCCAPILGQTICGSCAGPISRKGRLAIMTTTRADFVKCGNLVLECVKARKIIVSLDISGKALFSGLVLVWPYHSVRIRS